MKPKEKAEELFEKMLYNDGDKYHHCSHYVAKNCALIALDEIKELYNELNLNGFLKTNSVGFKIEELKKEIEKL